MVWLAALCGGSWWVTAYQFQSDQSSAESYVRYWPKQSSLEPATGGPTLVLFLHPKCPCSRASLSELERLFAHLQRSGALFPKLYVVATLPENGNGDWANSDTVQRASRLPGASVVIDRGGVETSRFGATTSGTVMFFDGAARRRYAGGVTLARGIEGSNIGCDALSSLLERTDAEVHNLPAFGCRLCLPGNLQPAKCLTNMCPANAEH